MLADNINSFDVNDFEINFLRGLDLEDGASTITDFTSNIIASKLLKQFQNIIKKFLKLFYVEVEEKIKR